ncbi:MAG: phosphotransferase family protein [Gammaproteobacteria bacterium]|nr:phosphotransferase family protein [Gammaproteobacteria bacterium]
MDELTDVINLESLANWMSEAGLGDGPIESPQLLAGGTQNYLMKFRKGKREFVLRRPPRHLRKNSNETMIREARVLNALRNSTVPHPELIAACEDQSVLSCCFYLMEPIHGFNPREGLPNLHKGDPGIRHRMGLSMVEGLTELGNIDYMAVGLDGFGKPEGFLQRQVPRWISQLESYKEFDNWPGPSVLPGTDSISVWLEANIPTDFSPGIMHGDYHMANVMFSYDGPEMVAIVDWELCTIGDPLLDLGWLMAVWADPEEERPPSIEPWYGFPTIDEMIQHYARHSSRDMSSVGWYGVLACFKLGVILEGTYARYCAKLASKETGELLHAHAIDLFKRAGRMINKLS